MKILILPKFVRQYKKLPQEMKEKEKEKEKEKVFRADPFHKSLKTHKLRGPLKGFWSFSINQSYRIIFEFVDEETVRFYSIGNHDVYL